MCRLSIYGLPARCVWYNALVRFKKETERTLVVALQNCCIMSMKTYLGNHYYIPDYQREYSWEEDELNDFVKDLMDTTYIEEESEHFFGQIVVHNDNDEKRRYIVDGQQRTITSVIFLRVLQIAYDKLYKESNIKKANYRQSDISSIMIGREDDVHLTLGPSDKDYFYNQIQIGSPYQKEKSIKKSHNRMRFAFNFFSNFINNQFSNMDNPEDRMIWLDNIYTSFSERFNVLYMEVTTLDQAYTIFETLNARGTDLAPSDLIKNFIFKEANENIDEIKYKWNNMVDTLGDIDCTKYIRHFYNSRYEFIREKDLFKSIANLELSKESCVQFMDDMYKNAKLYYAMARPEDDVAIFENHDLRESLSSLKILRATTFYPVILAMKGSRTPFSDYDILKVVKRIEAFVFRNYTICRMHSNQSEVLFASMANDIYNGVLSDVDDICDEIGVRIVSDEEFVTSFELWSISKNSRDIIRYIFKSIHNYLDKNMEISIDNSIVHIEHIMPVNVEKWDVDEETHKNYLWRLGNMALLSGGMNVSISNNPFNDKREVYKKSKIEPNKDICNYDEWNKFAIEDRQKQLAQYALKIWKK